MEQIELNALTRKVLGKRVRHMRKQGRVPANLFGHGMSSVALEVEARPFITAFAKAGMNTLIALRIDGATEPDMALIRGIQRDVISGELLHADLYKVSMTKKLRLSLPLTFVGEAPGVASGGILVHSLDEVEIECLPKDLIHSITVDVSSLAEIGSALYVKDLKVGGAIAITADPETLVVKVQRPEKEEEAPAPEAAPAEVDVVTKKKEKEEEAS